jgi:hypothetical protein
MHETEDDPLEPSPDDEPSTDDEPSPDDEPSTDDEPSPDDEPLDSLQPSSSGEPAEPKRQEWRIWKLLRLAAYVACVGIIIAGLAVRSTYVGVKQSVLDIGDELGKLGDVGSGTPLILNGQPIHVASSVHNLTVTETLDRAESLCRGGAEIPWGAKTTDAPPALDAVDESLETEKPPARFLMRQQDGNRGVVVCFAAPDASEGEDDFKTKYRRVKRFLKTGDINEMGRLRYLYARETEPGHSQLIGVWTEGPFNFYAMARPADGGDAAGSDPDDAPRPPDAVRLLSATIEEAPYAVRVYQSTTEPAAVAAAYDQQMPKLGWKLMVPDGDTRVYQKEQITLFVTPTVHEGKTLVSMLHMGSDTPMPLGSD